MTLNRILRKLDSLLKAASSLAPLLFNLFNFILFFSHWQCDYLMWTKFPQFNRNVIKRRRTYCGLVPKSLEPTKWKFINRFFAFIWFSRRLPRKFRKCFMPSCVRAKILDNDEMRNTLWWITHQYRTKWLSTLHDHKYVAEWRRMAFKCTEQSSDDAEEAIHRQMNVCHRSSTMKMQFAKVQSHVFFFSKVSFLAILCGISSCRRFVVTNICKIFSSSHLIVSCQFWTWIVYTTYIVSRFFQRTEQM